MQKNNYSFLSKLLHRFYLGNYFVSETSYGIEKAFFQKDIKAWELGEIVFITGLARAGTTALFNKIYDTGGFASLKYSDMPFLLMPNWWRKFNNAPKTELTERAHKDGIQISSDSPEALDEYFWKVFLKDSYIKKEGLVPQSVDEKLLREYQQYIKLVCNSCGKRNYLSKNNNNILRLSSLKKVFSSAKIIVLYRTPLQHTQSLLKQHFNFIALQQKDGFALDYFNYLGHHEFGLNHKPFNLSNTDFADLKKYQQEDLNYWLLIWRNYYRFLLEVFDDGLMLVSFEDLCQQPALIEAFLNSKIKLEGKIRIRDKFEPPLHTANNYDQNILDECHVLYEKLNAKRAYKL